MKTPSKTKLGFDLVLGGFMLGAAACLKPYDIDNVVIACIGLLWIAGAAVVIDRNL